MGVIDAFGSNSVFQLRGNQCASLRMLGFFFCARWIFLLFMFFRVRQRRGINARAATIIFFSERRQPANAVSLCLVSLRHMGMSKNIELFYLLLLQEPNKVYWWRIFTFLNETPPQATCLIRAFCVAFLCCCHHVVFFCVDMVNELFPPPLRSPRSSRSPLFRSPFPAPPVCLLHLTFIPVSPTD